MEKSTGSSRVINLVSSCYNFYYERRDVAMRFAVTCSSTHKVFLNIYAHNFCLKTKCHVFLVLVKICQLHNTRWFKISYSWFIQISCMQPLLTLSHNCVLRHNVNILKRQIVFDVLIFVYQIMMNCMASWFICVYSKWNLYGVDIHKNVEELKNPWVTYERFDVQSGVCERGCASPIYMSHSSPSFLLVCHIITIPRFTITCVSNP